MTSATLRCSVVRIQCRGCSAAPPEAGKAPAMLSTHTAGVTPRRFGCLDYDCWCSSIPSGMHIIAAQASVAGAMAGADLFGVLGPGAGSPF